MFLLSPSTCPHVRNFVQSYCFEYYMFSDIDRVLAELYLHSEWPIPELQSRVYFPVTCASSEIRPPQQSNHTRACSGELIAISHNVTVYGSTNITTQSHETCPILPFSRMSYQCETPSLWRSCFRRTGSNLWHRLRRRCFGFVTRSKNVCVRRLHNLLSLLHRMIFVSVPVYFYKST